MATGAVDQMKQDNQKMITFGATLNPDLQRQQSP